MGLSRRLLLLATVVGSVLAVPAHAAVEGGVCTPNEPVNGHQMATDPNGPYYHQARIGTFDGEVVAGSTLLADHASVPDAVVLDDGTIAVYFVNGAKNIVARGISDGDQLRDRHAIVIDGVKGGIGVVDPDVIRLPNGDIRLAYFSGFGPPMPGEDHIMCVADSTDGIHFESVAVIFRGPELTDPSLTVRDGVWYLAVSHGTESYVARSTDGITFETLTTVTTGGVPEITTADDGSLHLYVCGRGIVELTSPDGVTWTELGTVLPPGSCDPSVVVGTDAFVYKTFPAPATG